jgi:uncharacterized protein (DUF697 family)
MEVLVRWLVATLLTLLFGGGGYLAATHLGIYEGAYSVFGMTLLGGIAGGVVAGVLRVGWLWGLINAVFLGVPIWLFSPVVGYIFIVAGFGYTFGNVLGQTANNARRI